MNELAPIAILVALFALRCIAPLIIMISIGYGIKRLADSWWTQDEISAQSWPLYSPIRHPVGSDTKPRR